MVRNRTFSEEVGEADIVSIRQLLDDNNASGDQQDPEEYKTL
jgi:hypothetical protein